MKKIVCLFLVVLIFAGCAPRFSLKGTYQEIPYAIPLTKTTSNDLWLEIMDFLNQEKIAPKFIKKKKSLIITDTVSFRENFTVENTLGQLEDSTKYIVLPVLKSGSYLKSAYAHWTIKIHKHKNQTAIIIELSKVAANYNTDSGPQKLVGNKVSTGVFEKKLQAFLQAKGLL